jgi:hypothetical protein
MFLTDFGVERVDQAGIFLLSRALMSGSEFVSNLSLSIYICAGLSTCGVHRGGRRTQNRMSSGDLK